jgi:hypothetical protein
MTLSTGLRKFVLTTHITFSVGWLGSVICFLVLAIAGITSSDAQVVSSSYLTMDMIAWFVIVPACFGALLTGVIEGVGTQWGLFKHYWVLVKFILTILSTLLLLLHMQPISVMAEAVSDSVLLDSDLRGVRIQLIANAAIAIVVILFALFLSVYKPWGKTGYGIKKQNMNSEGMSSPQKRNGKYVAYVLIGIVVVFIIMHLIKGGHSH